MIGFITLTPAGSILDSAGRAPELFVNPGAIAAVAANGLGSTLTLAGGTFNVKEPPEQIEALIIEAIGLSAARSGRCRFCGCTDEDACIPEAGGCHWVDPEHTICSECVPITEERP